MTLESQPPEAQPPEGEKLVLNSPADARNVKDFVLWAGVIALAVLTVYSPALHGKFLWDDDRHVAQNPNLRDAQGLVDIWTKFGVQNGGTVQYYPLTHTSWWLEYQLAGFNPGDINPAVFHATNMALQAIAAILLWFVLRELEIPGAWVIAAIFALHPIEVESVAWISERKNLLAGVFSFATVLAYLKSGFGIQDLSFAKKSRADSSAPPGENDSPDPIYYWVALCLFACALLSKSASAPLPGALLVLIWWKRGRLRRRDFVAILPFIVMAVVMACITAYIEHTSVGASGSDWSWGFSERIIIAGRAIWFYVGKILWPAKLTFMYPQWNVNWRDPHNAWQWIFPAAALAALIVLFLLRKKIGRGPFAGALIYVGMLAPVLGFVNFYPMRYSFVADHFQYLAGPALIALIVAAITCFLRKLHHGRSMSDWPLPYVLASVLLVVLAVLTVMQSQIYADQLSLWTDTVAKNPGGWMPQDSLALSLVGEADSLPSDMLPADRAVERQRLLNEAAQHYAQAVKLKPDYDLALANWGRLLLTENKPAEALEKLDRALAINRNRPGEKPFNATTEKALIDRGRALIDMKRYQEAKSAFDHALTVFPPAFHAQIGISHAFLAQISLAQKNPAQAMREYDLAVAAAPKNPVLFRDRAKLLTQQGSLAKAAADLQQSIDLNPLDIDAYVDLAMLQLKVGNLAGAHVELQLAGRAAEHLGNDLTPEQGQHLISAGEQWKRHYQASTQPSATRPSATRPSATRSSSTPASTPATIAPKP